MRSCKLLQIHIILYIHLFAYMHIIYSPTATHFPQFRSTGASLRWEHFGWWEFGWKQAVRVGKVASRLLGLVRWPVVGLKCWKSAITHWSTRKYVAKRTFDRAKFPCTILHRLGLTHENSTTLSHAKIYTPMHMVNLYSVCMHIPMYIGY